MEKFLKNYEIYEKFINFDERNSCFFFTNLLLKSLLEKSPTEDYSEYIKYCSEKIKKNLRGRNN